MMRSRSPLARWARAGALTLAIATCSAGAAPATASAKGVLGPVCGVAGLLSGLAGKACNVVQHGDTLVKAGGKLLHGHVGGAIKTVLGGRGGGGGGPRASTVIGLAAIGAWVLGGAKAALNETATVLSRTTSPQLGTTWFSSTYWRMAGIAALLTLPFLFAAVAQALIRSDLALLARAAFGYLPLSLLAVSVAAPLTMLLLAASDQMSAVVSSAAGHAGTRFLTHAGATVGVLSLVSRSPFLAFLVGLLTAAGAIVLWIELLMREAAVYIVVLMLPLAFAALVWPARRVWAIRAVELLVALILSKFAIVAVLVLGGAALGQDGAGGVSGMLTGLVLVVLGAFAPWALLRLLPLAELASGTAGQLRGEAWRLRSTAAAADTAAGRVSDWAGSVTAGMRRQADETSPPGHENGGRPALENLAAVGSSGAGQPVAQEDAEAVGTEGVPPPGAPGAATADPGPNGYGAVATTAGGYPNGAGAAATATGGHGPDGHGADGTPSERRYGMPQKWQAENMTWTPLVLGPEGCSPRGVWPPDDGGTGDDPDPRPPDEDRTADDHDPRPPGQAPQGGRP